MEQIIIELTKENLAVAGGTAGGNFSSGIEGSLFLVQFKSILFSYRCTFLLGVV